MGTPNIESGVKEPGVSRFSDMVMGKRTGGSGSGRVDRVSKIDLSVKLDEDSVDDEDEEMESSEGPEEDVSLRKRHVHGVEDEEDACSPQPSKLQQGHESGFRERGTQVLIQSQSVAHRSTTVSERSTVEDESPPSSPAGLSASAAHELKNEVSNHRFQKPHSFLPEVVILY